jgi:hypothetical protein
MNPPPESGRSGKGKEAERGTLGKYVKRMSTVFRREKSSKSVATSAPATAPAPQQPKEEVAKGEVAKEATKETDVQEEAAPAT